MTTKRTKKQGRPPTPLKKRKAAARHTVWLTLEADRKVRDAAESKGVTVSAFLRALVTGAVGGES